MNGFLEDHADGAEVDIEFLAEYSPSTALQVLAKSEAYRRLKDEHRVSVAGGSLSLVDHLISNQQDSQL